MDAKWKGWLVVAAAGCGGSATSTGAVDLVAPPAGLVATDLVPGQPFTLQARGVPPGTRVAFLYSGTPGVTCPARLGGACLDLAWPNVLGFGTAGPAGNASVTVIVPAVIPVGERLGFQAAVRGAPGVVSNLVLRDSVSECGDGIRQSDEACDDGEVLPGDGCDAQCDLEFGGDAFEVTLGRAQVPSWERLTSLPWDASSPPDPYVTLSVSGRVAGVTDVQQDTTTPTWQQTFVVDVLAGESLVLDLYDRDPGSTGDDVIGQVVLTRDRLDEVQGTGEIVVGNDRVPALFYSAQRVP